MTLIGIRKEDKNQWERRVPIVPQQVRELGDRYGIRTVVQDSSIRAFDLGEYLASEAIITEGVPDTPVLFGIKEMPISCFREGNTYIFFSHVIKGQEYNMPVLTRMMELGCNLIDYEKITDENGRRLVFFGKEAGQAGMIDSLWALGKRLAYEGLETPFSDIRKTIEYRDLEEALSHLKEIGERITQDGLPDRICPIIMGFAGYGNVSLGAQEVLSVLPHRKIEPGDILGLKDSGTYRRDLIYMAVFREEHMVELKTGEELPHEDECVEEIQVTGPKTQCVVGDDHGVLDLQDYYDHPERYAGVFGRYVPHLTLLMNCIYWDERYPRLVTREQVRRIYRESEHPTFRVVGDISCDYEGAIEVTLHSTDSGHPTFIYDPEADGVIERGEGRGLTIMAVDNLPAELPRESSTRFSRSLFPFIESIAKTDYSASYSQLTLAPEVKRALILHQGVLTPPYLYLQAHIDDFREDHISEGS